MNGPRRCPPRRYGTRLRGASANGPLAPTAACAALQDVPGVRQVDTDPRTRSVVVRLDAGEISPRRSWACSASSPSAGAQQPWS